MKGKILAVSALLLTLPAALFAWGGPGCPYGGYGPGMGGRWFGGFFGGGPIMLILNILILALLIFFAVKYFKGGVASSQNSENPLEILKKRYAKGEITKEVFDSMKREIKEG